MQIRAHQLPPLFKMYILNGDEVFFGLYPLVKHTMVFRRTEASGEAADAQFIEQAQAWFDAIWDNISYEFPA